MKDGITRARGFRLYLPGPEGRRLVDLWQDGGRAVLGHKGPGELRELKNAAERGLLTPLPHPLEGRFMTALGRLFPGRRFRLYAGDDALRRALAAAALPWDGPFPDPALDAPLPGAAGEPAPVTLWRPFLGAACDAPLLVPVLPWPLAPAVLVLDPRLDERFPPGDTVAPALLAPTIRAVYNLLAAPERGAPRCPRVERALAAPGCPWRRRGIYLSGPGPDAWPALEEKFRAGGFLLPPSPAAPVILPGELSPGEDAALARLL